MLYIIFALAAGFIIGFIVSTKVNTDNWLHILAMKRIIEFYRPDESKPHIKRWRWNYVEIEEKYKPIIEP